MPQTAPPSIPCLHCRYDLIATPRAGTCPECGRAAESSHRAARSGHQPVRPLSTWATRTPALCGAAFSIALLTQTSADSGFALVVIIWIALLWSGPLFAMSALAHWNRTRRSILTILLVASLPLIMIYAAVLFLTFVAPGPAPSSTAVLAALWPPVIGVPYAGVVFLATLLMRAHSRRDGA